jgi:Fic family protein
MNYLVYILIGVIGFALGRRTRQSFAPATPDELDEMREESREALTERTERRKEKILEFMAVRQTQAKNITRQEKLTGCNIGEVPAKQGKVTCNDIEKLLGVSDSTARKYLKELESENKIKQIKESGKEAHYTLGA